MKRFLLALLTLLLSVQTAVAAVCQYCEHVQHDGGMHVVAAVDSPAVGSELEVICEVGVVIAHGASDPATMTDAEPCTVCHLGSASIPTAPAHGNTPLQATDAPSARSTLYSPSHIERIQHVPLVHPVSS